MNPRAGPLAVTALGTPLSRSIHSRRITATGQLVSVRKPRVSVGTGARKRLIVSLLSPGKSVMVGRLAPLTWRSGSMLVNDRNTFLLLGLGARKNGRASAEP